MQLTTYTLILSTLIALVGTVPSKAANIYVVNPEFRDAEGDGTPDGWSGFPDGNGTTTRIEQMESGVKLVDTDSSAGVGIQQWVQVEEGREYQVDLVSSGSGGGFLYTVFSKEIPGKAADLDNMKLAQKREWISAGKPMRLKATAPEGARVMKIWIYSPRDNTTCTMVLTNIKVSDTGSDAAAAGASLISEGNTDIHTQFTNRTDDGLPEGWEAFPSGNGSSTKIEILEDGGVRLVDTDSTDGVGIQKWMPVTAGTEYEAVIKPSGSGGAFLYMVYSPDRPAKAADLNRIKISEKREWISAGKETTMRATAPGGAGYLKLWIYSPQDNVRCTLDISGLTLTEKGTTEVVPMAEPPPAPPGAASYPHYNANSILPEGGLSIVDFETGDMSQVRTREGGAKEVVSPPEPVRSGKYALKVQMDHKHVRTEVTGYRSAAFGEYKYGWSIYIPKEFDAESSFSIVTQWHDWGSGREYPADGGPPTSMYIADNTWRLKLRYQDGDALKIAKQEFTFGSIDPNRGKWTDFYLEVNWQSPQTGGGYFRLYMDGERVIDYDGPTWYDGKVQGPFFKMGIYKGAGSWKGDADRTYMYFDEFRMGDSGSARSQVDPAQQ
ncbi:MAG: polysaccharide lyase [Kiritimatiellae bacterium]|nr:polysaccharide lyase [Kiritimatiellia bacterium]